MYRRQVILLSVLVLVVPALVSGSGSFSEVTTDRGIDAAVANDENAYLGVETESPEGYVGGEPIPVLRLTDQLSGELVLESVSTASSIVEVETQTPSDIGVSEPFTVRVSCRTAGSESASFTIDVTDQTTRAVVDRTVPITCLDPEIQSVAFSGCGNTLIEAEDAIYPLTVMKVVDNPSTDSVSRTTVTLDSDGTVGPGQGGKLVAIEANGERYENPNTCAVESGSDDSVTTTDGT